VVSADRCQSTNEKGFVILGLTGHRKIPKWVSVNSVSGFQCTLIWSVKKIDEGNGVSILPARTCSNRSTDEKGYEQLTAE
jgi:hypothetical protein